MTSKNPKVYTSTCPTFQGNKFSIMMVSEIHAFSAIFLPNSNDYQYMYSKYKCTEYNGYSLYAANILYVSAYKLVSPKFSDLYAEIYGNK
jgi:hypothetical protein